jgi:uncharacterized SAM-binding protein YcdF (DUF218 family)
VLQLAAFSWYPIADLLMRPLEERALAMGADAPTAGYAAILVLGGIGRSPPSTSIREPELGNGSDRVWLAAQLYHTGLAPKIIASGGSFETSDGTVLVPEAELMRTLLLDFGVPTDAILLEPRSRNTRENASESRKLLGDQDNVALVTSAYHMPRAMREMQLAGIHAFAFPSGFLIPRKGRPAFQQWVPSLGALRLATQAIKEWLGILSQLAILKS